MVGCSTKNYQAIFQVKIGGKWLDYVRHKVAHPHEAEPMMLALAKREGKPFRVSVEHWNNMGEAREPITRYGDWGT